MVGNFAIPSYISKQIRSCNQNSEHLSKCKARIINSKLLRLKAELKDNNRKSFPSEKSAL